MDSEWDPAKEAANIAKHAIRFVAASAVFADPHHLVADSTKPEYGEARSRRACVCLAGATAGPGSAQCAARASASIYPVVTN